jgi:hypothetical protein
MIGAVFPVSLSILRVAEELAKDFDTNWMTAVEIVSSPAHLLCFRLSCLLLSPPVRSESAVLCHVFISVGAVRVGSIAHLPFFAISQLSDDIYLGAENHFNLFTLARNVEVGFVRLCLLSLLPDAVKIFGRSVRADGVVLFGVCLLAGAG